MNKLFRIIAIALLVMGLAIPAYAVVTYEGGNGVGELKVACSTNLTRVYTKSAISTAQVIPGKVKILAISIANTNGKNTENVYGLADAMLTSGDADTFLMAENESASRSTAADDFVIGMSINGLSIDKQLQLRQGPYTVVNIYYIQDRP